MLSFNLIFLFVVVGGGGVVLVGRLCALGHCVPPSRQMAIAIGAIKKMGRKRAKRREQEEIACP